MSVYNNLRISRLENLLNTTYKNLAEEINNMVLRETSTSLTSNMLVSNVHSIELSTELTPDLAFFIGEYIWYSGIPLKVKTKDNVTTIFIIESHEL